MTRPIKELKGFRRIYLDPGEVREITFDMSVENLKFYDHKTNWMEEPDKFFLGMHCNSDVSWQLKIELK